METQVELSEKCLRSLKMLNAVCSSSMMMMIVVMMLLLLSQRSTSAALVDDDGKMLSPYQERFVRYFFVFST
jgi:hypothetical protein